MTLDELKIQVANDLKVNDERLDTESLKNQELYSKYLEIKSNFELLMYKAKGDYKILYRDKWEYYGGKADAKIYETKPFDLKVLKSISARGWDIKNAIQWKNFEAGLM